MDFDWSNIFKSPFQCARETALQSFQYKILHRFIPCKYNLKKWNKEDSDECKWCNDIETIEHFIFSCPHIRIFWNELFTWWHQITLTNIQLECMDIIFGINNPEHDNVLNALNFCILYGKYYIYRNNLNNNLVSFKFFKQELNMRLKLERSILLQNGKSVEYNDNWRWLYEGTLQE